MDAMGQRPARSQGPMQQGARDASIALRQARARRARPETQRVSGRVCALMGRRPALFARNYRGRQITWAIHRRIAFSLIPPTPIDSAAQCSGIASDLAIAALARTPPRSTLRSASDSGGPVRSVTSAARALCWSAVMLAGGVRHAPVFDRLAELIDYVGWRSSSTINTAAVTAPAYEWCRPLPTLMWLHSYLVAP